jgi:hypothetical protein
MSETKSPRIARHNGRPIPSYVDPYPGQQASDRIAQICGSCDGSGVYSGPSSWIWQKGKRVEKWCFQCNGSGRYSLSVGTLRKRAKEAAYQRDYADEIRAAQEAAWAAVKAAEIAEAWEEAHAEQARRAALVSGFAGEVGERIKGRAGAIRYASTYDASYGYHKAIGAFLIIELDGGQVVKISGTGRSLFGHARGDRVKVTGTVKAHGNYQGQDQAVLTRAAIESEESGE